MEKIEISVLKHFSPTPGPRYIHEGKFSGELFRKNVLYPRVSEAIEKNIPFEVNLDKTAGYGTSFLEESFGGLIRMHKLSYDKIMHLMTLISKEEDYLIDDVNEYLKDAYEESKK
jgi:hypothetical protein